jgi:hypothetical protein
MRSGIFRRIGVKNQRRSSQNNQRNIQFVFWIGGSECPFDRKIEDSDENKFSYSPSGRPAE